MTTLIDSGGQVSSISSWFCLELTLQIQPLGRLLELEGTGGSAVPYLRFVEVNLEIPWIKNEDVLLLVIPTMTYSKKIPVVVGSKIIDSGNENNNKTGACKSNHDLETGSFWGCHVWVATATPHGCKQNWGGKGHSPFLPKDWHCGGEGILPGWFQGPVCTTWRVTIPPFSRISVHTNTSVRTLYVGPCAHRTNTRSPVAYSIGADCDLWRVTSGVLLGTHLSVQLKCPFHQNPYKVCGWSGHACQPSATGGPPNRDFREVQQQSTKGWVLGGPGPPRHWGMAQTWARTG